MLARLRGLSLQLISRLPAVLPGACALCGHVAGASLCNGCHRQFFERRPHRCAQCATALPAGAASAGMVCGECLREPPAFDATIAAVDYAPPVDQLVLGLKFGGRLAVAPLFAGMLQKAVAANCPPFALPALLTAVPLGTGRLMERGFNQALEIARPLSRSLGIALDARLVARHRDTRAQALLPPDERRKNMRGAFIVPGASMERVRGMHVGVVDDVVTTGETLNELAATLKRFGAARVTNFVFAKTPQK
ncbi:MAG: ComF family protein [Noviherbaspirillum sp.]|nr:ComF family protein [Noviherbaspirillum sp.]